MKNCASLLLALLPTVQIFASSGYGINLSLQSPLVQETEAGTVITAAFLATNQTEEDATFTVSLDLPPDWISIPFEEPFISLKGNETKVEWVAIRVPPNALAGTYSIRYALQGREHPSLLSESQFSILVLSRNGIQSSIEQTPKYKIAGENYKVTLTVINTGNVTSDIAIEVIDSAQFDISLDVSSPLCLKPGEIKQIHALVQTPKDLKTPVQHFITISTQIQGDPNSLNYLSSTVDIFPQNSSKIERYELLPMKTVVGYGMKNEKKQLFIEQYGSGTLDEAKKKTLISSLESLLLATLT